MIGFVQKYKVLITVFALLIIYGVKVEFDKNQIIREGVFDIGYVNFYSSGIPNSGPYLKYIYYINDKKYDNMVTTEGDVKPNNEGRYYRIKYLKDDPSESILYLDKQITDSIAIAKFKEDMLRSNELEIEAIRSKLLKK